MQLLISPRHSPCLATDSYLSLVCPSPMEVAGVSRCPSATAAASSALGTGRASDSLCLLFLIPHGPGQALLPENQLSQSLASLSLQILSHLRVVSSQASLSFPLRLRACSRVPAASGWQRWVEKPRTGCCLSAVLLPYPSMLPSPPASPSTLIKGPCFSENLYLPNKH